MHRSLTDTMNTWGNMAQGIQQQPSPAAPATTATTAKGVNTAVVAVAAMYNDKCKPGHEAAVQASDVVAGVRSALTMRLRQGSSSHPTLPNLAGLGPAELKSPGTSYRYQHLSTGVHMLYDVGHGPCLSTGRSKMPHLIYMQTGPWLALLDLLLYALVLGQR